MVLMKEQPFEDVELVGERGVVFARFKWSFTLPDGSTHSLRTMAYYRIADGKIAMNDVISDPAMMQIVGPLLAPPSD
jgi:hypothetical protein